MLQPQSNFYISQYDVGDINCFSFFCFVFCHRLFLTLHFKYLECKTEKSQPTLSHLTLITINTWAPVEITATKTTGIKSHFNLVRRWCLPFFFYLLIHLLSRFSSRQIQKKKKKKSSMKNEKKKKRMLIKGREKEEKKCICHAIQT